MLWQGVAATYGERLRGESEQGPHEDYVAFYAAGRLVLHGQGGELYDIGAIGQSEREAMGRPVGGTGVLAYFNPPFVAAAFAPLAALPLAAAAAVVGVVALALIAAAAFALDRLLGFESWPQRLLVVLGFVTLNSVVRVALHGQLSMVLLLGWLLFIVAQTQGRERLSGVALALLLVKPQMAILPVALLLWKRQWQPLRAFAAVAAVLVLASVAVSGLDVLVSYPKFLLQSMGWHNKWGVTPNDMFGWNGLAARLVADAAAQRALALTLMGATLLAVAVAFRGPWRPQEPRFLALGGALIMASLLINTHLFMQDLSLMALALALGAASALRAGRRLGWWPLLALGVWFAQLYGLRILEQGEVNILTPVMAAVFVVLCVASAHRAAAYSRTELPLAA